MEINFGLPKGSFGMMACFNLGAPKSHFKYNIGLLRKQAWIHLVGVHWPFLSVVVSVIA
jgi:hypothetical protein